MILLFGASGLLGWYVYEYLKDHFKIIPITSNEFNILTDNIDEIISKYKPSIIINCTNAFEGSFKDQLYINSLFPYLLSKLKDIKVIQISTNGVFKGFTGHYDEDSIPDAIDAYGITKILGETERVTLIRTSILGESNRNKKCFMEWLKIQTHITGFDKHLWNGVTCLYLAKYIKHIIDHNLFWKGIRHVYDPNDYSKYDLACLIKQIYYLPVRIDQDSSNHKDLRLKSKYQDIYKESNLKMDLLEQKLFTHIRQKKRGTFINRTTCRFCKTETQKIIHLGDYFGLAGGFLKELSEEDYVYPLTLRLCNHCKYIHCEQEINPDELFKKHYFYFSSMIPSLVTHFEDLAQWIHTRFPLDTKIVEMGCNDGVLLNPLYKLGFKNLIGVDPSHTVKHISNTDITIYNSYFDDSTTDSILKNHGEQDLFISCNSFAHINDMDPIIRNISKVLKKMTGKAIIEVHYAKHIFENKQFDFIYHEHVGYYTIASLFNIFDLYGLSMTYVEHIPNHGGSLRCIIENKPNYYVPPSISEWLDKEAYLYNFDFFKNYETELVQWKKEFQNKIYKLIADGKKVYGYGASGRANTIMNFAEVAPEALIDDAPSKIGSFTPVLNVPIVNSDILYSEDSPDYVIIFAWPYANYIMEKHKKYKGTFIIPLPDIKEIQNS